MSEQVETATSGLSPLQERLLSYMETVGTKVEKGAGTVADGVDSVVNFGSEQIPLIVEEIIAYNLVSHTFLAVATLVPLVLALVFLKKSIKLAVENDWRGERYISFVVGSGIFTMVGLIAFFSGFFYHLDIAAKCFFAPRLYMLEYVIDIAEKIK